MLPVTCYQLPVTCYLLPVTGNCSAILPFFEPNNLPPKAKAEKKRHFIENLSVIRISFGNGIISVVPAMSNCLTLNY